MNHSTMPPLSEEVLHAVQALDFEPTYRTYWEQNEYVFLKQFLPAAVVERHLLPEVERLRTEVHRNYIPKHKKGGVSASTPWQKKPRCSSICTVPRR